MRRNCFLLLLSLVVLLLFPRPAPALESWQMQELSREIHGQLDSLRQQSRHLTEQLLIAERELEESSSQAEALRTELQGLSSSLSATNEKLSGYSLRLTQYEEKLRWHRKFVAWATVLIVLFVLARVVTIILRFKGIHLPEMINILL